MKLVTSGGVHHCGPPLGNTTPKVGRRDGESLATVFDLTDTGIEPKTYRADSNVFNHHANLPAKLKS